MVDRFARWLTAISECIREVVRAVQRVVVTLCECSVPLAWCPSIWDRTSIS